MVLLLSRPKGGYSKDDKSAARWDAELEVAKNRKGDTPVFRLMWDAERTAYDDWQRF